MRSAPHGRNTSGVEVTNVSRNGFRLLLDGEELFVPFKRFPWSRDASIGRLVKLERPDAALPRSAVRGAGPAGKRKSRATRPGR